MSVVRAIASGRRAANALMVDACTVTRAGEPVWDDVTGTYTDGAASTLYSGKCRVRMPDASSSDADAGEASWTLRGAVVSLPIVGSESVRVGDVVTVTASVYDTALVGQAFSVAGLHSQSLSTARRLKCEAVDRDA